MSGTRLIDATILDDLIETIGSDALRPVVALFLDETRQLAAAVVAGAASPTGREAVRRAAHSLKSSAGQLGAAALAEAAAAVERAAEAGAPLVAPAAEIARLAAATTAAFTERLKAG